MVDVSFMTDEELAERGLKRVVMYSCVFWDEFNGWTNYLDDSEELANLNRGYGNFAGMGKVTCIVSIDAREDNMEISEKIKVEKC